VSKSRVSRSLRPNQAAFNEAVLFIRGKQVSDYEHAAKLELTSSLDLPPRTSVRYAEVNLAGNYQQRQGEEMTVVRNGTARKYLCLGLVILMATSTFAASNLYNFTQPSIDGKPTPLADFKGKVILLVNVASQCGYTPQYTALEAIYNKYKDQGFVILGFPANNFGQQEPGPTKRSRLSARVSTA
jgi:hypothetical protein